MKSPRQLLLSENFITTMVVVNVVVLFVAGFGEGTTLFSYVDDLFTILFIAEALVKIHKWGWRGYWHSRWNRIDLLLLLLSLPSLLPAVSTAAIGSNAVLSLRSFRLFKMFRLLEFVPHVDQLLAGVKLACKASFIVTIAIGVLLLIFSIFTTYLFGNLAPEAFGNPGICLYSMYRLFTVEGWYDLPELIAESSSPLVGNLARVYFSVLVFGGGIIGMSLINSLFVDAMASDDNAKFSDELRNISERLERIEEQLKKLQ